MSRMKPTAERMTADEALFLSRDVSVEELNYCYELYPLYWNNRQQFGGHGDRLWELMCLLAFFYHTGRIQGIRNERARRKAVTA